MGKAGALAPSRLVALQDEDKSSVKDEKEGSGSEGSEEGGMSFLVLIKRKAHSSSSWRKAKGQWWKLSLKELSYFSTSWSRYESMEDHRRRTA